MPPLGQDSLHQGHVQTRLHRTHNYKRLLWVKGVQRRGFSNPVQAQQARYSLREHWAKRQGGEEQHSLKSE